MSLAGGPGGPIFIGGGGIGIIKPIPFISNFSSITKIFGDSSFYLNTPSSTSDGTFSYSINNNSVATIDGNKVTIVGAGIATITATQAETTSYSSGNASATLTVLKANPTLSNFNNITKNFGNSIFAITHPISNSTGAFTYTSSDQFVATINGRNVTIVGAGITTIIATQAETDNYNSGTITTTLSVAKSTPNLSNFNFSTKNFGDSPFVFSAPISNINDPVFTYSSSNTSVATISGNTITIVGIGATTITATQSETNNYNSSSISSTLNVVKTDINILKQSGYTASQLKLGGYTATELKQAGYILSELKDAGYIAQLRDAGFTASQLKQAGYTLRELLIETNYTINELKNAGYVLNHNIIASSTPNSVTSDP